MSLPVNSILLWCGASGDVPVGWHICDGSSGTPNLAGKFVYAASSDSQFNSSSGSATMFHSHVSSASGTSSDNSHSHTVSGTTAPGPRDSISGILGSGAIGVAGEGHTHSFSGATQTVDAHYHLIYETPTSGSIPYVDIYYIMRIT